MINKFYNGLVKTYLLTGLPIILTMAVSGAFKICGYNLEWCPWVVLDMENPSEDDIKCCFRHLNLISQFLVVIHDKVKYYKMTQGWLVTTMRNIAQYAIDKKMDLDLRYLELATPLEFYSVTPIELEGFARMSIPYRIIDDKVEIYCAGINHTLKVDIIKKTGMILVD